MSPPPHPQTTDQTSSIRPVSGPCSSVVEQPALNRRVPGSNPGRGTPCVQGMGARMETSIPPQQRSLLGVSHTG